MSDLRLVLIHPPSQNAIVHETDRSKYAHQGHFPPLALLMLATYLKKQFGEKLDVSLVDAQVENLGPEQAARRAAALRPDIVGIAGWTDFWPGAFQTLGVLRKNLPAAHLTVGGPHTLVYPQQILQTGLVDSVVVGDGEIPVAQLVRQKMDGTEPTAPGLYFRTDPESPEMPPYVVENLDDLPIPDRSLLSPLSYRNILNNSPTTSLITARGCPFGCDYCNPLYPSYRKHSPARVVEEFRSIASLGIREVEVFDGTFNSTESRALLISRLIQQAQVGLAWSCRVRPRPLDPELLRAMRAAGCNRIHIGIETTKETTLRAIGRSDRVLENLEAIREARRQGFFTVVYVLFGFPGEKVKDFKKTFHDVKKCKPNMVHMSIMTLYPETRLYRSLVAEGKIENDLWAQFTLNPSPDFLIPVYCLEVNRQTMEAFQAQSMRSFYLSFRIVWGFLKRVRSWHTVVLLGRMAWGILSGKKGTPNER